MSDLPAIAASNVRKKPSSLSIASVLQQQNRHRETTDAHTLEFAERKLALELSAKKTEQAAATVLAKERLALDHRAIALKERQWELSQSLEERKVALEERKLEEATALSRERRDYMRNLLAEGEKSLQEIREICDLLYPE